MELLTGLGLAIPAGLNAYIPPLTVAIAQKAGWIRLDEPYALLGEWWAIALVAVLLAVAGVLLVGRVHAAKASARPVVNASTGGAGEPVVSAVEDVAAVAMSVFAVAVPVLMVGSVSRSSHGTSLEPAPETKLEDNAAQINEVRFFGGLSAIAQEIRDDIMDVIAANKP